MAVNKKLFSTENGNKKAAAYGLGIREGSFRKTGRVFETEIESCNTFGVGFSYSALN